MMMMMWLLWLLHHHHFLRHSVLWRWGHHRRWVHHHRHHHRWRHHHWHHRWVGYYHWLLLLLLALLLRLLIFVDDQLKQLELFLLHLLHSRHLLSIQELIMSQITLLLIKWFSGWRLLDLNWNLVTFRGLFFIFRRITQFWIFRVDPGWVWIRPLWTFISIGFLECWIFVALSRHHCQVRCLTDLTQTHRSVLSQNIPLLLFWRFPSLRSFFLLNFR